MKLIDRGAIVDIASEIDKEPDAFEKLAAVLKNLDLVISPDSCIAHLAGGLGIPTWVMLNFAADWHWLIDRDDSPWYPTMKLFRQPAPSDWPSVFEAVEEELRTAATPVD